MIYDINCFYVYRRNIKPQMNKNMSFFYHIRYLLPPFVIPSPLYLFHTCFFSSASCVKLFFPTARVISHFWVFVIDTKEKGHNGRKSDIFFLHTAKWHLLCISHIILLFCFLASASAHFRRTKKTYKVSAYSVCQN